MFRQSIRRFGTTALRAAEGSTAYATKVSTAQGFVNGLTEGNVLMHLAPNCVQLIQKEAFATNALLFLIA